MEVLILNEIVIFPTLNFSNSKYGVTSSYYIFSRYKPNRKNENLTIFVQDD